MTLKDKKLLGAWIEIDLKALEHNYKLLTRFAKKNTGNVNVIPVVKADAYGHGVKNIAPLLTRLGAKLLAVSDVNEGIELRRLGIKSPILLFESTLDEHAEDVIKYRLIPTISNLSFAETLNRISGKSKKTIDVQIEIDTGMGRLGVSAVKARNFISSVKELKHLNISGIFTHFPSADTDVMFSKKQLALFSKLLSDFKKEGLFTHAANSAGAVNISSNHIKAIRPGLMLYGLYPDDKIKRKALLKPVMTVKSKVILIKDIEKGQSVSYGRTFVAKKKMKVAVLSIGYRDGYPRILSNKSCVLIQGKRCPLLGRVTMDQIMVDASSLRNLRIGDLAVIMGTQKKQQISAEELARQALTITYEIVCSFGNILPRIYNS